MKKLLLSICSVCFLNSTIYSQIGIYTDNPRSILHIDALGNNSSVGAPSVIEQKDDVLFSIDSNKTPSLTIGASPRTSINDAQLELASNSKGFLPNKVALTSNQDIITIPSPQDGMIVYNTVTGGEWRK